jgi:hypothetical protein
MAFRSITKLSFERLMELVIVAISPVPYCFHHASIILAVLQDVWTI